MKLGIFQPQRIGDIVICLPIAKYYHDKGYEIIWPINKQYFSSFQNTVDYVTFVEYTTYESFITDHHCNFILDLCFNTYGNESFTRYYNIQNEYTFDQVKYKIGNVPFEEKWNLKINRNYEDEAKLVKQLVTNEKYIVCHTNTTRGVRNLVLHEQNDHQIIHINPVNDGETGVFSWLSLIEGASAVLLTNSCYLNIINQLDICKGKRIYYKSLSRIPKEEPVLKGEWRLL